MSRGPLLQGDLGHCLFRLSRARATSRSVGFDIKEVLYPGFEGRAPATSLDHFLQQVEMQVDVYRLSHKRPLVVATGFGALVLLALRARGNAPDLPSVIQGAVPWESTRARATSMPERGEATRLRFAETDVQQEFVAAHVHSPLDASEWNSFFSGFATCTAYAQIYDWIHAGWLASLEGSLAARPAAIDGIRVWLCGADELVGEDEHDAATRALGATWRTERAKRWGHFPYLDAPGPWVGAIAASGV